jgi:hypothetical protein
MFLLAPILAALTANAACPADAAALRSDVVDAVQAYDDWEWADFDQGVAEVRVDLGCLTEVVTGPDAQATHQLFALAGARKQDEALATRAFRGLLALDPDYDPGLVLAAKGSLLRRAWREAKAQGAGHTEPLPPGAWFIDGKPGANELPTEHAVVVQLLDASGGLLSWYLDGTGLPATLEEHLPPIIAEPALPEPSSEVPERTLVVAEPEPVAPERTFVATEQVTAVAQPEPFSLPKEPPVRVSPEPDRHASRGLLASGLVLVAVGAGGITAGEILENDMMEASRRSRAESLYTTGLISSFGGATLGLTGGGLVLGAMVKGQW